MIPRVMLDSELTITNEIETNKTYKITDGKIKGYVNDIEALKQAIYKVLNTEKYEYPIYSFSYGIDLESLIGKDSDYVKIELKRRIQECLLQDERIESIENFSVTVNGDSLTCLFDVISIYGELVISKEVNV